MENTYHQVTMVTMVVDKGHFVAVVDTSCVNSLV